MDAPRIQYAKTEDGVSIAYGAIGQGPAVVSLYAPPFCDFQRAWELLPENQEVAAAIISGGRQFVQLDLRGMGSSSRVEAFDLGGFVSDLEAVVEALGLQRFDLFAITYSTPIAIAYAARHPDRLLHLALQIPFARGREALDTAIGHAFRALREQDWGLYTRSVMHMIHGWEQGDRARSMAELMREAVRPEDGPKILRAVEAFDVQDLLGQITVPTLVTYPSQSSFIPIDQSRAVAAGIPQAQFEITADPLLAVGRFIGAVEEAAAAPSSGAFRTILFTDLADHTAMMQRLGDAKGREVLREHERITRETLAAHAGTEVKAMGDGFMASFGSAQKALECAVALQQAFAGALSPGPSPKEGEGGAEGDRDSGPPSLSTERGLGEPALSLPKGEVVRLHIGVNAGEPIAEDDDLFGSSVILAARAASKAVAGQILVTNVVRELVAGKGFSFADAGEFEMKGFEEPVRLFELRWQEAAS